MHNEGVPKTYISHSSDCQKFMMTLAWKYFSAAMIAVSVKPCIAIVHNIPFKYALRPGALDLHFTPQWLS